MRTAFFLLLSAAFLLPTSAMANEDGSAINSDQADTSSTEVHPGSKLEQYEFEDQHGEKKTISAETKLLLMSFEMDLSKQIHEFLQNKEPDYLEKHNAQYVVDITPMPSIITWLFAGPKMRKYKFPILLADDDEFAPKYPKEPGKIAALKIDKDRTISSIKFFESMEEVDKAYFQEPRIAVSNMADQITKIKAAK